MTWKLSVSDNGPGIPPEEREKVFSKFYQVEKDFTGQIEGFGLGLALTDRIADACGGRMELSSEVGKGTTFTVTFPLDSSTV